MMKIDKKNIIIFLLVIGIVVVLVVDFFLVFNNKNDTYEDNNNNNNNSNDHFVSPPNIEHTSYNCVMDGKSYTPVEDVKVYMYDIEGTINLKYDEDKDSYIVTAKENYKFINLDNYLGNVEKMELFKNHEYERDDANATIKLAYEELVEYDKIFEYIEQLKEVGYDCVSINT